MELGSTTFHPVLVILLRVVGSCDDDEGTLPWSRGTSVHDEVNRSVVSGHAGRRLAAVQDDVVVNHESNGTAVDCAEVAADIVGFANR